MKKLIIASILIFNSSSDLTDYDVTKTQLLEFSFKFLLEREPSLHPKELREELRQLSDIF